MDKIAIMRRVIELSRRGMRGGFGGPYGTVIVKDGEIVGEGHNEVLATNDPTAPRGSRRYSARERQTEDL
jgi:guanine deaminase